MKAAVFHRDRPRAGALLQIEDVVRPRAVPGHVLLKVLACGVCRTDLHIVEGDLPSLKDPLIPGHQIVGEIVETAPEDEGANEAPSASSLAGALDSGEVGVSGVGISRVGVSWIGGVDGDCWFCRHGMENLCDHPVFTGYTVNGGYAEYALVRRDFTFPLPAGLDAAHAAPLLCAGIIGFRSLRVAGVEPGERVGLFGFGSSAGLAIQILRAWKCDVYVVTRGEAHRKAAESLGATWVGGEEAKPPVALDRAVTFAPSGKVVVDALSSLRKGGVVAINAIHLDTMPAFDYDSLLWGERQMRSVTNMTRQDARDFLALAAQLSIRPRAKTFSLDNANDALQAAKQEIEQGSAVILPNGGSVA